MSKLCAIEVDFCYGKSVSIPRVVIYDEDIVPEARALKIAEAEEQHPAVVVVSQEQFNTLFADFFEKGGEQT